MKTRSSTLTGLCFEMRRLAKFPSDFSVEAEDPLRVSSHIQRSIASNNRDLFELIYPGVVQPLGEVSTLFVPPHDQRTRRRWLTVWMLMFLVGYVGRRLLRVSALHAFYQNQIRDNFMKGFSTDREFQFQEDCELHQLDSTRDGLPYPLVLSSAMIPKYSNYHVVHRPFVFTPEYSGIPITKDGDCLEAPLVVESKDIKSGERPIHIPMRSPIRGPLLRR